MVMSEILFENVLIIGPSSKRKGGIASVIKMYEKHIKAEYFASTNVQSTLLSFLFFPFRLLALTRILILNKKIKIIHIHGSSDGSFYRKYIIYVICKFFNKKVIFHLHSGRFDQFYNKSNKLLKNRIRSVINNSDCVIVLSEVWKNYLSTTFEPKKIFILGNMISESMLDLKSPEDLPKSTITFAYLGKIFQPKGVYDLLDCIIENDDALINKAKFVFAGNGDEDKTIKYLEKDKHNLLNFVGWLDENEKNGLLLSMDVLILPSYSEGMPVSILEAMSYKKGVIATPVGGVPDIIEDNFNGKIITPGNKIELYEAINYYIQNPKDIERHGEAGYNIAQHYFPIAISNNLKVIYNTI